MKKERKKKLQKEQKRQLDRYFAVGLCMHAAYEHLQWWKKKKKDICE